MRIVLAIASSLGLIASGVLALFILSASHAWGGKASVSLVIIGSVVGFSASAAALIIGYSRIWFKPVAYLGAGILGLSSCIMFLGRERLLVMSLPMIVVATLVGLHAYRGQNLG